MAGSQGLVNWKIVDAELDRVPQDFKDPKFYALKHVVEILTSSNPQGMVGQLRDQEQRLVTLVDQMVQGYHSGFAKSIQNYSQILQLFGDAKEQVDGLKKALADASRQLSAQSRTLQQQWRKTLALECSLGLLDDIQLVADAPGRIDEALAAKDWSAAVQLLLEACSKLATEELAKVGALRKLRQDMLAISLAIQSVMDELKAQQQRGLSRLSAAAGGSSPNLSASVMPAFVVEALQDAPSSSSSRQQQHDQQQQQQQGPRAANVAELVGCLQQLDALEDAKVYLLLQARAGIRRMVLEVVEAWAAQEEAQQQQQQGAAGKGWSGRAVMMPHTHAFGTATAAGSIGSSSKQSWAVQQSVQLGSATAAPQGGGARQGGWLADFAELGPGKESVTYAALVKRGLGSGSAGGPYLTPAVFLAVSNFVSDALIVISEASLLALPPPPQQQQQQQQQQQKPAAAAGAAAAGGSGFGVQHQQAEAQQGLVLSDPRLNSTWLRQSVEEWVVEGFLPQVWVDLRGRCTAALEDPEAFRPQQAAGTTGILSSSSSSSSSNTAAAAAAAAGRSEAAAAHRPAAAAGAAAAAALPPPPRCVVAAATFAVQVLQEVMAWLPAMPVTAAGTLSGVLDAILSQVLEAMTAQAAACLAGTKAGRLALLPQLSLLMATEPDALLLPHEDPVAFYVPPAAGGYGDSGSGLGFGCWSHAGGFDCSGFQAALKSAEKPYLVPGFFRPQLKVRGFGLEGEASAQEALLFTLRERPGGPDQLLVGSRPAVLVQLAALAESCDWVADCLRQMAAAAAGGQLAAGSWLGRRKAAAAGRSKHTAAADGSPGSSSSSRAGGGAARGGGAAAEEAAAVAGVLQQLADRYRSFAGACSRALRLDLLLMAARQLYALSAVSHICEEDDVMEAHPSIGGLARLAARAAEELSPHLSSSKMNYVFGPIPGAAARYLMWVLEDIGEMNAMGVERMIRSLALLQGHLCGPGALLPGTNSSPAPAGGAAEVSRAYDRAKQYYTLVGLPAEEVVRLAGDRPGRFSVAEWQALLLVHVPGRTADERQLAALHRALDKHYHLSAGQKVAEFFEGVVTSVQAPVQNFTGNVSAGFKGGFSQAKALLNKAAASVSEAATSVGAAAAAAATKGKAGNEK
ncbi:hypothetical protein OEZ85_000318 [Tetradesmus obliquus]|uniref:Exocyst complex component Sec8 n=1 Tax=Tetradesmus obliquus TaxID=3088 RepID=A0ABY8UQC2_TETOB|nr:hypothetical protein OEZ85_000318 [Tetradesmus obliquus]